MASDASHIVHPADPGNAARPRSGGDSLSHRLLAASIALLMVPIVCFVLALVLLDFAPLKPISAPDSIDIGALQSPPPMTND